MHIDLAKFISSGARMVAPLVRCQILRAVKGGYDATNGVPVKTSDPYDCEATLIPANGVELNGDLVQMGDMFAMIAACDISIEPMASDKLVVMKTGEQFRVINLITAPDSAGKAAYKLLVRK